RFKQYNDSFGHPAGDEALRLVAQVLRANVRTGDLVARYGGEEFSAILPNAIPGEAMVVAERIREACAAQEFPHRDVTLSIGIAHNSHGSPGAMVESADRALYAAKHRGRNQVAAEATVLLDHFIVVNREDQEFNLLPEGWTLEETKSLGIDRLSEIAEGAIPEAAKPLIRALTAMLDLRDRDTERHSDRVTRFAMRLAKQAVVRKTAIFTQNDFCDLHLGALLHDIGKAGVPDAILQKPEALSSEEWAIMRQHPVRGAELLADMPPLSSAVPIVRSHHERWDGMGYPRGLSGTSIPIEGRIAAVADVFDALCSERPYKPAWPMQSAYAEIVRCSGTHFDPACVAAFQLKWSEISALVTVAINKAA
ncbi:MAG: diguanylate cyclase, partial [Hyphomicrobiales bacterium]